MEKARNDKSKYISELQDKLKEFSNNDKPARNGFICIAYDKEASEDTQNAFLGAGFPADLAECLLGCMQQDETLANVVIAASNALVQMRMLAVQMQMKQAEAQTEKSSKRKSKKVNS